MSKTKKTLSSIILAASLLYGGCKSPQNFPKRPDPVYSFESWMKTATFVKKFQTLYFDSGVIYEGPHPLYANRQLYVSVVDSNGSGKIGFPSSGDRWRSSSNSHCMNAWEIYPPNLNREEPPAGWEHWATYKTTLERMNRDLYPEKQDLAKSKPK